MKTFELYSIPKGIGKNYRIDTVDKLVQFLKKAGFWLSLVAIDYYEARNIVVAKIYYGGVRLFSEEIRIRDELELELIKEKIKNAGYIHVATDYKHYYEPIQSLLFIKGYMAGKEAFEVIMNE